MRKGCFLLGAMSMSNLILADLELPKRFLVKLEKDIEEILRAEIPDLLYIGLFGSCARNEMKSSSDIDLLVVTKEKIADRRLVADLRMELDETLNGVRTDVVFVTEKGISEANRTFRINVYRDMKIVWRSENYEGLFGDCRE